MRTFTKTATGAGIERLRCQYLWLQQHADLPHLPHVLNFKTDGKQAILEMEEFHGYGSFFSLIHSEVGTAKAHFLKVLEFLHSGLHSRLAGSHTEHDFERYVREKLIAKIEEAASLSSEIRGLLKPTELGVNGTVFRNFSACMNDLMGGSHPIRLGTLSEPRCDIHGDVTVENILISKSDFVLLDPNGENWISSPVVDYAKISQSLHSGYEFLKDLPTVSVTKDAISFDTKSSPQYVGLNGVLENWVSRHHPKHASLLRFHEAVHYARLLPYRIRANPKTGAIFYGTFLRLLNEALGQA